MLLLFVLCTLPTAQAGLFDKTSRTKSIDELYEDCTKNAERGYYTKALEVCNRVRNVYRDSPLSTLAELTIADIYYKRGDYEQARIAYEDFHDSIQDTKKCTTCPTVSDLPSTNGRLVLRDVTRPPQSKL